MGFFSHTRFSRAGWVRAEDRVGNRARQQARPWAWACLLAGLLNACSKTESVSELDGPRHVFLISLDTLRTDATGLYSDKLTTPFLDSLAERGIVFDKHVVNSNNTLTSHATMLTGLYPDVHGTIDRGSPEKNRVMAPEVESLAERFADAGYQTASFTTHPAWLGRPFGLDQGFQEVQSDWYDAQENNQRFLDWIDTAKPRRMFAFLHYYDAHSEGKQSPDILPYEAPPEYLAKFAPERPADFTGAVENRQGRRVYTSRYLQHYAGPFIDIPADHLAYLRGSYDAGVAKLDADLRELFEQLEERGILQDSLILITSDHGEEFKDHRRMLHMEYFEEIMRVPLLVVPPAGDPLAKSQIQRVPALSRCIDVAPTLLDWAGLPPLNYAQGFSLRRYLEPGLSESEMDELEPKRSLFGHAIFRGRDELSEFKYAAVPNYYSFYDLDADPLEQESLLERKVKQGEVDAERLARIDLELEKLRDENHILKRAIGASAAGGPPMSEEEREILRSLGYFGDKD